jgi:DNA-directed RNA polymerase specialized sigma24 family protein
MNWEDLKNEPTEDLIEYMKCKVEPAYIELAKAAYVTFNFRFRADVEDKARKIGKYWDFDRETCDQQVEKAFQKFYQYPFKFIRSKCKVQSVDDCVKFYLYRIVQRQFIDYYNEIFQSNPNPYEGTEEVVVEFPDLESLEFDEAVTNNYKKAYHKMVAALSSLSRNHKIIYLTYKVYERKGFKLPRKLLAELREITGLKQSSIRVYKKEAFEKIEEIQGKND